jgi:dTDP-4-dehydrorhamnose reductase
VPKTLITGGGGQLASDFASRLDGAVALSRRELDIADGAAVAAAFEAHAPELVLNCAAFHNLDECEARPDRAWEVNVRAVRDLAQHCARTGAKLVHVSTNYVFDGRREAPYAEDDLPAPRSIYALTKLAGEHAALAYAPGAIVVRTGGLYGAAGSASKGGNFVQRMLKRAAEQGALKMVADQRLQPTFTEDLADAILAAVERDAAGILHLTASGACSWHEFTVAIMEQAGVDVPVEPVETTIGPGGIDRPLNGVLARPATDAAGLEPLRPWRDQLDEYVGRLRDGV